MKKKIKKETCWMGIAFLLTIFVTVILYGYLPTDLPMQFSSSGEATWTLPKFIGVWLLPLVVLFLTINSMYAQKLTTRNCLLYSVLLLFNMGMLLFIAFFM